MWSQKLQKRPRLEPNKFAEHMTVDPSGYYDGNFALERETWLKEVDLETIKILHGLHKKNPNKYSKENMMDMPNFQ